MALILLSFVGTLAIFFRIWRELDAVRRALGEIRESLQYNAMDIAQQNRELTQLAGELRRFAGTDGAAGHDPANENLGTLLDKGLPNLMHSRAPLEGMPSAPASRLTLTLGAEDEEDDLLRRLETGPRKTAL